MPLREGLLGSASLDVTDADTAVALRSGDVPVLATPRLLALCEEATMAAVRSELDDGTTTVGMRVQIDHVLPTPPGRQVTATASLTRVEGRRLTFAVEATQAGAVVAHGTVTRVLVDRQRFLERAS